MPGFPTDDSQPILKNMLSLIEHRGPDESGIYMSDRIGLGNVRLSIIGLEKGTMPLSNQDETLWISFNGEVYNYIELRQELADKGYVFDTDTDTEVVLYLYEEYGPGFVEKLNGQFAIAIWDKKNEQLFLGRDRVGIRPLFYTFIDERIVFSSEMKSFLEFPGVSFEICEEALSEYFTFWTCLPPKTVFKGIHQVPCGSYLLVKKNKAQTIPYWNLLQLNLQENEIDLDTARDTLNDLLLDSVKLRLRADVEVGCYLSGGLDSTVTTSYATKYSNKKVKTFSLVFDDKEFDESPYQRKAQELLRTEHTEVHCEDESIASEFESVVWFSESPLFRTAPAPMKILANGVNKKNIKVVLTGEGADELLGGYNIFKEMKIRRFWAKNPDSRFRPSLLTRLYPYLPHIRQAKVNHLKLFFGYKLQEVDSPIYSHLLRWNNSNKLKLFFSSEFKERIADHDPAEDYESTVGDALESVDELTAAQIIELQLFMSGYLLSSQGDRMAMAHSVEGRYPFLDHRIIEFCLRLPARFKINGLNEKFLLKRLFKDIIPDEILDRSKQPYRAPIQSVFDKRVMDKYSKGVLSKKYLERVGIFDWKAFAKLRTKFESQTKISELDKMAFTGILSVQLLYSQFVDRNFGAFRPGRKLQLGKIVEDY